MAQIRVLQVVSTMDVGGIESFLMNTLRYIDKKKFQFIFLCYGKDKFVHEDEILALGAHIIRTPDVKEVGPLRHIKNIEKVIKEQKVDIVHAHTDRNAMFSMIAAKNAGVKVRISHSHNTRTWRTVRFIKKPYFIFATYIINKYATAFFACGEKAGQALFSKDKVFTVINNGVDLNEYLYDVKIRKKVRDILGIANKTHVLGHIGRFEPVKNHDFLIDAFDAYKKTHADSRLILLGDGSLRHEMAEKVAQLNLTDSVLFLGNRSDVNELCSAMDILVMPSLREGLPVALVEAQANNLPCLVSDTVDPTVKLSPYINFESLQNNADQWAHILGNLITDRDNAKEYLRGTSYDMQSNIKKFEKLYKDLAGK